MKRALLLLSSAVIVFFTGCDKKETQPLPQGVHAGEVQDIINASSYSYLLLEEGDKEYWIAVPQMDIKEGETVYYSQSMEMKNFRSESLNRTFPSILFVQDASKQLPQDKAANPHGAMGGGMGHPQVSNQPKEDVKVDRVSGGKTIEEVYAQKESLAGKIVKIRGKVTKYNPEIMDLNWIHIQDGTGANGTHDLLVTSKATAEPGQVIVVEGKVAVNQDFGQGYAYPVLIEEAKISK